jgi:SAM-dependent methyltransferase
MSLGMQPLSEAWGLERGIPLHRYYRMQFFRESASAIHGHCLEFQKDLYTTRLGGSSVTKLDILQLDHSKLKATTIADLMKRNEIPSDRFDCIICIDVLQRLFEVNKVVSELYRVLKPGGILLVANPQINACAAPPFKNPQWVPSSGRDIAIWYFTPEGLSALLGGVFGAENVTIRTYGNSLTAAGALRGLVTREFTESELNYHDPRFAVVVCARATKRARIAADARGEEQEINGRPSRSLV